MSSDPICLGCGEELTISPQGWRAKRDNSLRCAFGPNAGKPHTTQLGGSR